MTFTTVHALPIHAVDRTTDYFTEIGRSFSHASFSEQISLQVILVLGAVVAILGVVIAILWVRAKRQEVYIPHGWLLTPESIENTLKTALEQRSKFEVQFHSDSEKRRSTFCSAQDVANGVITVECAGLQNINKNWMGRLVDCYFRIQDDKRNQLYYTFTSKIAGIRPVGSELCHVSIAIPEKLEQKQKRASLRVDPPEQYILGIGIWPEKLTNNAAHDLNIRNWGKSVLTYLPGKRSQVRLSNISAGGIKLTIKKQDAKEAGLEFNIGDKLFVLLDLWEPDSGQRQRFWLLCRIQMPFIDYNTRDVDLGLQFLQRAQTKENSNTDLEWMPALRDNEVDEIGNWAIKRHLELYREKGLE